MLVIQIQLFFYERRQGERSCVRFAAVVLQLHALLLLLGQLVVRCLEADDLVFAGDQKADLTRRIAGHQRVAVADGLKVVSGDIQQVLDDVQIKPERFGLRADYAATSQALRQLPVVIVLEQHLGRSFRV